MAKKKQTTDLQTSIERGFTALAEDIAESRKEMATKEDIKNMATKDDIASIRKEMATKTEMASGFAGIMSELAAIKARLKAVEEKVDDHSGHSKEIDHAFERIAAIERHLGIRPKVR